MILDASALYAILDVNDPCHEDAEEAVGSEMAIIHAINFGEAASVLYRRYGKTTDAILDDLLASPDLEVVYDSVEREAARLHANRPSKKISLADCFAAALAMMRAKPVAAADQDFRWFKQAGGVDVRILG